MSAAREKGTKWETRVVNYLKENGFPFAERRSGNGAQDRGDINIPGVVLECKNQKAMNLGAWIDEMVKEKANAGVTTGAVIFPRRSHETKRSYVLLELADYVELIK